MLAVQAAARSAAAARPGPTPAAGQPATLTASSPRNACWAFPAWLLRFARGGGAQGCRALGWQAPARSGQRVRVRRRVQAVPGAMGKKRPAAAGACGPPLERLTRLWVDADGGRGVPHGEDREGVWALTVAAHRQLRGSEANGSKGRVERPFSPSNSPRSGRALRSEARCLQPACPAPLRHCASAPACPPTAGATGRLGEVGLGKGTGKAAYGGMPHFAKHCGSRAPVAPGTRTGSQACSSLHLSLFAAQEGRRWGSGVWRRVPGAAGAGTALRSGPRGPAPPAALHTTPPPPCRRFPLTWHR